VTRWLGNVIRREQRADPQWKEEERRERTGKMGENIHTEDEAGNPNR
jgi:hypothetical protein